MKSKTEMKPETEILLTKIQADWARLTGRLEEIQPDSELDILERTLEASLQLVRQERQRRQNKPSLE